MGACCTGGGDGIVRTTPYRYKNLVTAVYPPPAASAAAAANPGAVVALNKDAFGRLAGYCRTSPNRLPRVCRKLAKLIRRHAAMGLVRYVDLGLCAAKALVLEVGGWAGTASAVVGGGGDGEAGGTAADLDYLLPPLLDTAVFLLREADALDRLVDGCGTAGSSGGGVSGSSGGGVSSSQPVAAATLRAHGAVSRPLQYLDDYKAAAAEYRVGAADLLARMLQQLARRGPEGDQGRRLLVAATDTALRPLLCVARAGLGTNNVDELHGRFAALVVAAGYAACLGTRLAHSLWDVLPAVLANMHATPQDRAGTPAAALLAALGQPPQRPAGLRYALEDAGPRRPSVAAASAALADPPLRPSAMLPVQATAKDVQLAAAQAAALHHAVLACLPSLVPRLLATIAAFCHDSNAWAHRPDFVATVFAITAAALQRRPEQLGFLATQFLADQAAADALARSDRHGLAGTLTALQATLPLVSLSGFRPRAVFEVLRRLLSRPLTYRPLVAADSTASTASVADTAAASTNTAGAAAAPFDALKGAFRTLLDCVGPADGGHRAAGSGGGRPAGSADPPLAKAADSRGPRTENYDLLRGQEAFLLSQRLALPPAGRHFLLDVVCDALLSAAERAAVAVAAVPAAGTSAHVSGASGPSQYAPVVAASVRGVGAAPRQVSPSHQRAPAPAPTALSDSRLVLCGHLQALAMVAPHMRRRSAQLALESATGRGGVGTGGGAPSADGAHAQRLLRLLAPLLLSRGRCARFAAPPSHAAALTDTEGFVWESAVKALHGFLRPSAVEERWVQARELATARRRQACTAAFAPPPAAGDHSGVAGTPLPTTAASGRRSPLPGPSPRTARRGRLVRVASDSAMDVLRLSTAASPHGQTPTSAAVVDPAAVSPLSADLRRWLRLRTTRVLAERLLMAAPDAAVVLELMAALLEPTSPGTTGRGPSRLATWFAEERAHARHPTAALGTTADALAAWRHAHAAPLTPSSLVLASSVAAAFGQLVGAGEAAPYLVALAFRLQFLAEQPAGAHLPTGPATGAPTGLHVEHLGGRTSAERHCLAQVACATIHFLGVLCAHSSPVGSESGRGGDGGVASDTTSPTDSAESTPGASFSDITGATAATISGRRAHASPGSSRRPDPRRPPAPAGPAHPLSEYARDILSRRYRSSPCEFGPWLVTRVDPLPVPASLGLYSTPEYAEAALSHEMAADVTLAMRPETVALYLGQSTGAVGVLHAIQRAVALQASRPRSRSAIVIPDGEASAFPSPTAPSATPQRTAGGDVALPPASPSSGFASSPTRPLWPATMDSHAMAGAMIAADGVLLAVCLLQEALVAPPDGSGSSGGGEHGEGGRRSSVFGAVPQAMRRWWAGTNSGDNHHTDPEAENGHGSAGSSCGGMPELLQSMAGTMASGALAHWPSVALAPAAVFDWAATTSVAATATATARRPSRPPTEEALPLLLQRALGAPPPVPHMRPEAAWRGGGACGGDGTGLYAAAAPRTEAPTSTTTALGDPTTLRRNTSGESYGSSPAVPAAHAAIEDPNASFLGNPMIALIRSPSAALTDSSPTASGRATPHSGCGDGPIAAAAALTTSASATVAASGDIYAAALQRPLLLVCATDGNECSSSGRILGLAPSTAATDGGFVSCVPDRFGPAPLELLPALPLTTPHNAAPRGTNNGSAPTTTSHASDPKRRSTAQPAASSFHMVAPGGLASLYGTAATASAHHHASGAAVVGDPTTATTGLMSTAAMQRLFFAEAASRLPIFAD